MPFPKRAQWWQTFLMHTISTLEELQEIYSTAPVLASTAKEITYINAAYRTLIEHSPFVALASISPGGLDCSPRGDVGAVVRVLDEKTLAIPDRRDNNRIDSLRNDVVTKSELAPLHAGRRGDCLVTPNLRRAHGQYRELSQDPSRNPYDPDCAPHRAS